MSAPDRRARTGTTGEAHARRFLEARGYGFVAANWRCPTGELDLVMLDGEELAFIEVKTRHGESAGRAADAVGKAKATKLLKTGEWFVMLHPEHDHRIWRVDIVAITLEPRTGHAYVQHVINALAVDF
jgi:putative endonuclease